MKDDLMLQDLPLDYKGLRVPFQTNLPQKLDEVQVGIFYCVGQNLYYDSINLNIAEIYGEFLIYSCGHPEFWDKLIRTQPAIMGYKEYHFPRGRVAYNTVTHMHRILADPCIMNDRFLKAVITLFALDPAHTEMLEDDHYVCYKCYAKRGYCLD